MATASPAPHVDEGETVIEIHSATDERGRCHFAAFWIDNTIGPACNEHGVRGQHFHANPEHHAEQARQRGHTVRTIQGGSA